MNKVTTNQRTAISQAVVMSQTRERKMTNQKQGKALVRNPGWTKNFFTPNFGISFT